jgi:glutaredoxin-like protein NrdH
MFRITMTTIYSLPNCPQCDTTKRYLSRNGVEYIEIDLSKNEAAMEKIKLMGYSAAPVVETADGKHWSGFRFPELQRLVD